MKRLMLCLSLILACAAPCAAQTPPQPSTILPPNSWLFVAADTIQKNGIPFGSPDGTYAGRRVVTRHEFAVATARVLMSAPTLPPEPRPDLVSDVAARLEISPPAVSALIALVHEFSPDLSELGQDVPKAIARLEALRQWQEAKDKRGVLTPEQTRGKFAVVPANTWPFAAIQTIKADGIVLGYPNGTYGGRRPVTRYEFAVALARLLAQSVPHPATLSANLATDLPQRLRRAPVAVSGLIALVSEFSPEMGKLGQDIPQATARLEAFRQSQRQESQVNLPVARPFPDVPAGHWAASSVETLRQNGLMLGYPDGAYTTH